MRPAFVITQRVGGAGWSTTGQHGGFVAPGAPRIEIYPAVMLSLQASLGPDVCTLLLNLAMLAELDGQDRLVVTGGMERVRAVIGWGRERAGRIFNQVQDAGFVIREKQHEPGKVGRRQQFGATVLILQPSMYGPPPIADTDDPAVSTAGFSDSGRRPAATQSDVSREVPDGATVAPSDSGQPDSGHGSTVWSPGSGERDSGRFDVTVRVAPDGATVVPSGSGEPDSMDDMYDMDAGEHSSSSSSSSQPASSDDVDSRVFERARRLRAALAVIGFSDAADIIRLYDLDLVEAWVHHVLEVLETDPGRFTNPGGFLRTQLDRGDPPPTPAVSVAAAVRTLLDTTPAPTPGTGGGDGGAGSSVEVSDDPPTVDAVPVVEEVSGHVAEVDVAAIEARAAALSDTDRAVLAARVDAYFSSGPQRVVLEHVDEAGRAEIRAAYLERLLDADGR
jgi:hypothetical protein